MAEGPAAKALRASLSALGEAGRDEAAVQLAKRYAVLLDRSAVPSTFRAAFDRLEKVVSEPAEVTALKRVREALSAHSVASDLGPKYLAVLVQLGLTPAARGEVAGVPALPVPKPESKPEGKRDELKARRDQRALGIAADPR